MSKYDINFSNYSRLNTPPERRTDRLLAWFRALLSPVETLKGVIDAFRIKTIRRAGTTSQQLVFTTSLNDEFGITADPKINITTPIADGVYVGFDDPNTSGTGNNEEGASWEVAIDAEVELVDNVGTDFVAAAADIVVNYPSAKLNADQIEILDGLVIQYKFLTLTHELKSF